MKHKTVMSILSVLLIAINCTTFPGALISKAATGASEKNFSASQSSYAEYIKKYGSYNTLKEKITLSVDSIAEGDNYSVESNLYGNASKAVIMNDKSSVIFNFHMPDSIICNIAVKYLSMSKSNGVIEQSLEIDGDVPFDEAETFSYERLWKKNEKTKKDTLGNDIKPSTEEYKNWNTEIISDSSGYTTDAFVFAFEKGEHSIKLNGVRGEVAIETITLQPISDIKKYDEFISEYDTAAKEGTGASSIVLEGEDYLYKTDVSISEINDRSSYDTYPQSASKLKLNAIGGTNWQTPGQKLTWSFNIERDGFYKISLRFKQSYKDGAYVSRKLYIDGEVPFEEASSLEFPYNSNWQTKCFGNENGEYGFYLKSGKHTVTLEVCSGSMGKWLNDVEDIVYSLNEIYREVTMITGSSPDTERDYKFERTIPDTLEKLKEQYRKLEDIYQKIKEETGSTRYASVLYKTVYQIKRMCEDPSVIAKNLSQYKTNIGSLGTWLNEAREQPLAIDRIYIIPFDETVNTEKPDFFKNLFFKFGCFFASYVNDYNNIGQSELADDAEEIEVWVQSGRDQANIIRRITDEKFSELNKIKVNLKLVAAGSLLPSVLAKIGPDVSMGNAVGDPINYALRNANVDLSQFDDCESVVGRFVQEALTPYCYNGSIYALPETLTFPMFFYRKDIFKELGVSVPETWDEMMSIIPVLQRNSMTMAFPQGLTGYMLVLYKNGGELYRNNGEKSMLDTDTALETFREYTDLFTLWQLPMSYSFENRFRTGEMPCGIMDYSTYNTLVVYAPEIKGQWDFVPVPGKEKGSTISVGTGTNIMILSGCKNIQAAWKFLKWWTDTDAQSIFGIEMESTLGTAAKQPTANIEALMQMAWTGKEATNIRNALKGVKGVPEVPGGYYASRIIEFAVSRVYNNNDDPIEVIEDYNDELNKELQRKRKEFKVK